MTFSEFYRDKTVLVTGNTGFKGSWLSLWLSSLGAKVIGLGLKPEGARNHYDMTSTSNRVIQCIADVRNYKSVEKIVLENDVHCIFHLAARAIVRKSYDEPRETFDVNVGGTVNVLEAARKSKTLGSIVVITSDKCYENREWVFGYREIDTLGGSDPYSASKACAEICSASYRRSFYAKEGRVGLATARAGNVIGGGDFSDDRIIPDAVRAVIDKKPLLIRNPAAVRPWQYVLDALNGYLELNKRLYESPAEFGDAWNFGPSEPNSFSVEEIVTTFHKELGAGEMKVSDSTDVSKKETNMLRLSCDKANAKLGWRSVYRTVEAVQKTALWYRRTIIEKQDPVKTSLEMIGDFTESISGPPLKRLPATS